MKVKMKELWLKLLGAPNEKASKIMKRKSCVHEGDSVPMKVKVKFIDQNC